MISHFTPLQWKWPTAYGESVYVVMLGGLHHEEADILQQEMSRIEVRTVDTDVISILAGAYFELVLAFGRERGSLQLKARALPVFHALTGCGHSEGKARNIRRNY